MGQGEKKPFGSHNNDNIEDMSFSSRRTISLAMAIRSI